MYTGVHAHIGSIDSSTDSSASTDLLLIFYRFSQKSLESLSFLRESVLEITEHRYCVCLFVPVVNVGSLPLTSTLLGKGVGADYPLLHGGMDKHTGIWMPTAQKRSIGPYKLRQSASPPRVLSTHSILIPAALIFSIITASFLSSIPQS